MTKMMRILFCISMFLSFLTGVSQGVLTNKYQWKPLKIGAGGFVVGFDINDTDNNMMLARTDVGGAYRFDPATGQWIQLVTADRLPASSIKYTGSYGVTAISSAPSNPNRVYMAYGGNVYTSSNKGDKWELRNNKTFAMDANSEDRQVKERLVADPKNADVVYFATQQNGLWVSTNAGSNWTKVTAVPDGTQEGNAKWGVSHLIFDYNSPLLGGKTSKIYATSWTQGIWMTTTAGSTWQKISGPLQGGTRTMPADDYGITDGDVATDGSFIVAETGAGKDNIFKYKAGVWSKITPADEKYFEICLDPNNANRLYAFEGGGNSVESTDQGTSWTSERSKTSSSGDIPWLTWTDNSYFTTAEVKLDKSGRMWIGQGFGVFSTTGFTGTGPISWVGKSAGIEEIVANNVIAPPGGKPITVGWDQMGFYHNDPDQYPAKHLPNVDVLGPFGKGFGSGWSIDYQRQAPLNIAAAFTNHQLYNSFVTKQNVGGYSSDGGQTWTEFATQPDNTNNSGLQPGSLFGNIAISRNSFNKIVWAAATNYRDLGVEKPVYFTTDKGTSWNISILKKGAITIATNAHGTYGLKKTMLIADPERDNTFMLYHMTEGIFVSTDGGANFNHVSSQLPINQYNSTLRGVGGVPGEFWFSGGFNDGYQGKLFRSTDFGVNWSQLPNVDAAAYISLGKPEGGANTFPGLYMFGRVNGKTGVWRSVDKAVNWDIISEFPLGRLDAITSMEADKDVFGKVYAGVGGSGFVYGVYNAALNETVTGVRLGSPTSSAIVGSTLQMIAYVAPETASNRTVTWTSSNPAVATINSNGLISVTGLGTSIITVLTNNGGYSESSTFTGLLSLPNSPDDYILADFEKRIPTLDGNPTPNKGRLFPGAGDVGTQMISNPVIDSDNPSANVYRFNKPTGTYKVMGFELADTIRTSKFANFEFQLYGSGLSSIYFTLQSRDGVTKFEKTVSSLQTNKWNKINVDFAAENASLATEEISLIIFFINQGDNAAGTFYLDNVGFRSSSNPIKYPENSVTGENTPVTGVVLNRSSAKIALGTGFQLYGQVFPYLANNKNIIWSSSNSSIASVSSFGTVIGVSAGIATITATTEEGSISATSVITVTSTNVSSVALNTNSVKLPLGANYLLIPTVFPADAVNKNVFWSTSNQTIVGVNASGQLYGISNGVATITVTTQEGSKTAQAVVTVTDASPFEILVDNETVIPITGAPTSTSPQMFTGSGTLTLAGANPLVNSVNPTSNVSGYTRNGAGTYQVTGFRFTKSYSYADYTSLEFLIYSPGITQLYYQVVNSSDVNLIDATINATAASTGWLKVTVPLTSAVAGTKDVLQLNLFPEPNASVVKTLFIDQIKINSKTVIGVTFISVSPASATLTVANTLQLSAQVLPASTPNKNVVWMSSNDSIASVNSTTGLAMAIAPGLVTITATSLGNASFKAYSILNIVSDLTVSVTSINIAPSATVLTVDGTLQLTATVSPSNATNPSILWSTSDASIASINSTGLLTAVNVGVVTVTATSVENNAISSMMEFTVVRVESVSDEINFEFNLFPNPLVAGTKAYIQSPYGLNGVSAFAIKDIMGRTIINSKIQNGLIEIGTESLIPGIYIVDLTYYGKIYRQKLIVN